VIATPQRGLMPRHGVTLQPDPASTGERCRLCGGGHFRLRHEWPVGDYWNQSTIPLAVWDCEACGLTMLWPVPTAEQYPGDGDWFSPKHKNLARNYWLKHAKRKLFWKLFGSKQERFLKACLRAMPTGRFLDVGCGTGAMLDLASRHYTECVGIEPSPIGAAAARAKGFRVFESLLEDAALDPDYYDMIVMDAVIEHVRDPVETLRICHRALRPGGFVAMTTPKLGGPAYRVHGAGWNGFRHGWHTFLFTGKTLQACLDKAGFEYVRSPRRDRPLDDMLILWGRKPKP
jgi:SAM-dependent methyltransferase